MQDNIRRLINRGVNIFNPENVAVSPDVDLNRIAAGVVIHSGCKIMGPQTLIETGTELGLEGPATVHNCYVGRNVKLKAGYFNEAVFLEGVETGLGAHVRTGTIMEEQSSIAHTVGLKQTILFPFVTLGSLINFCDCFMAGGTSRKNHSEVGSSYIHFNYTPSQHKATPSLLGDVPLGVMLRQRPIFLGGQGGMVGPCRFSYGITTAAGIIIRKNEPHTDRLIFGNGSVQRTSTPHKEQTAEVRKINKLLVKANIIYLANLLALRSWYRDVRSLFIGPLFSAQLHVGLCLTLEKNIAERIKRLGEYWQGHVKTPDPAGWQAFVELFDKNNNVCDFSDLKNEFIVKLERIDTRNTPYIAVIQGLDNDATDAGTVWLQVIVDHISNCGLKLFPFDEVQK